VLAAQHRQPSRTGSTVGTRPRSLDYQLSRPHPHSFWISIGTVGGFFVLALICCDRALHYQVSSRERHSIAIEQPTVRSAPTPVLAADDQPYHRLADALNAGFDPARPSSPALGDVEQQQSVQPALAAAAASRPTSPIQTSAPVANYYQQPAPGVMVSSQAPWSGFPHPQPQQAWFGPNRMPIPTSFQMPTSLQMQLQMPMTAASGAFAPVAGCCACGTSAGMQRMTPTVAPCRHQMVAPVPPPTVAAAAPLPTIEQSSNGYVSPNVTYVASASSSVTASVEPISTAVSDSGSGYVDPTPALVASGSVSPRLSTSTSGAAWTIDSAELELGAVLGEGAFGVVRSGKWRGRTVAIKQIKQSAIGGEKALAEFELEIGRMAALQPHENVVQLYGVVHLPGGDVGAVVEFCASGALGRLSMAPSRASGSSAS
jgi:hypothetical protein